MKKLELGCCNWRMRRLGDTTWQEAVVPGTVYTDLLRNGNMEDPFWKDNEDKACALMEHDYEYEAQVCVEEELLNADKLLLHFDGLDTVADVYFNEEYLGHAESMHRIWEYDVTGKAKEENTVRVILRSPLKFIADAYKKYGNIGNEDTFEGFMHLRKAHYMFGWDWGPHIPDAGIFRPVSLLGINKARLDDVYIRQQHKDGKVTLTFDVTGEEAGAGSLMSLEYVVKVTAPDGTIWELEDSPEKLLIESPCLWWPNGIGEQPLYEVCVTLLADGEEVDSWNRRIGLRTMTMRIEKDEWGESFAHEVNGKAIFAMGADYIPEDNLLGRINPETTRKLLFAVQAGEF